MERLTSNEAYRSSRRTFNAKQSTRHTCLHRVKVKHFGPLPSRRLYPASTGSPVESHDGLVDPATDHQAVFRMQLQVMIAD